MRKKGRKHCLGHKKKKKIIVIIVLHSLPQNLTWISSLGEGDSDKLGLVDGLQVCYVCSRLQSIIIMDSRTCIKSKKKSHHFVVSALYFIHIQKHYVSVQQHYPVTKVTMFYDDVWENSMPHL